MWRDAAEHRRSGLAVAPGFINMLSWANESLIADGRGQSDVRQGVTLEVMGEGESMGPWNAEMKADEAERQGDIKYSIDWTSLGEYLQYLERKGVSPNVASFVGATTVRVHELGEGDVDPTPEQLARMRGLVRKAMDEGAMGVGSSLIYAPANFAETPELDRAGERGRALRRHVYQPYARRGAKADRGDRRADRDFGEIGRAGRNLSLQAIGQATIGARSMRRSRGSRRRGRADSRSPPICTLIRQARPGSTRRCRCGSRRAGSSNGSGG